MTAFKTLHILGYDVYTGDREALAGARGVISTLNPHSYVIARRDPLFESAQKAAEILLPDGVGIKFAARFLEGERVEKIAGADLHEVIIREAGKRAGSCFYLGSSESTLEKIKTRLSVEYPALKYGGYSPPYRDSFTEKENAAMINSVNSFAPDVLFVGMTAPKQEKWVFENRDKLKVPLICCIGAVFDFYAGTVKRPGRFWIRMGLEWLPRLLREPSRLWRRNFISTPLFIGYVIRQKVKGKR